MSTLDQKMYPEIMGVTYVVNAPWIFGVIWKVIYDFAVLIVVSRADCASLCRLRWLATSLTRTLDPRFTYWDRIIRYGYRHAGSALRVYVCWFTLYPDRIVYSSTLLHQSITGSACRSYRC